MNRKSGPSDPIPLLSSIFAAEPPDGMEVTEGCGSDEEWALWHAVVNSLSADAARNDPPAGHRAPTQKRD